MTTLAPALTPHGRLGIVEAGEGLALEPIQASRLTSAFAKGAGYGLLCLGADEVGSRLPPELSYWREFAVRYMGAVCALPDIGEDNDREKPALPPPADENLRELTASAPPMRGAEYLTPAVLAELWRVTDAAFDAERAEAKLSVQAFLKSRHPAWNLVGRVHFNLAENRKDEEAPFAFLATYTTRLSTAAKAQHLPLGKALREYSGAENRDRLLSLLLPVQRAAQTCPWLKALVDAGEIFHPLRWTPHHALRFLKDASTIESAGVVVRMPASWRMNRPPRPQVRATVGTVAPSRLGMDALLDFAMEVTLEGETLSKAEVERLLAETEGLAFIRGKWVEVDRERLNQTLEQFTAVERRAQADGLSFAEAMRLMAGAGIAGSADEQGPRDWSRTVAGPWLEKTLAALCDPGATSRIDPGEFLNGTLRPYQQTGVHWLYLLSQLKLGACLADDMGLGKTIQVLGLLLLLKNAAVAKPRPSLLVAPASLLANWAAEAARFAPSLRTHLAHPSAGWTEQASGEGDGPADFVITSYGYARRQRPPRGEMDARRETALIHPFHVDVVEAHRGAQRLTQPVDADRTDLVEFGLRPRCRRGLHRLGRQGAAVEAGLCWCASRSSTIASIPGGIAAHGGQ